MKKAWIVWGGWDGHEPKLVGERFARMLEAEGFEVKIFDTLSVLENTEELNELDLLVPVWTMGTITREQSQAAATAVGKYGVGLAGCHGGMCDSFRQDTEWQFMTGGQWVSHPGGDGVKYRVNIRRASRISTSARSSIMCMSIRRTRCSQRRATRSSTITTPPTARWTFPWCGRAAGVTAAGITARWGITTMFSTRRRRRK